VYSIIHFVESNRFRSISAIIMSPYIILLLFIIINRLSCADLKFNRIMSSNMTCVTIPLATLSSRSDDRFVQLKLFASPQFNSDFTSSCGKFSM